MCIVSADGLFPILLEEIRQHECFELRQSGDAKFVLFHEGEVRLEEVFVFLDFGLELLFHQI